MTEMFARLKSLRHGITQAEGDALMSIAKADSHDVICPTDLIVKNGKVVGYMSIGALPVVVGNFSTQHLRARDSFNLIHIAEQRVELNGASAVLFPIGLDSPFHSLFPEMGYRKLANVDLFIKEFNPIKQNV